MFTASQNHISSTQESIGLSQGVVIKVGSSSLLDGGAQWRMDVLRSIVGQVASLREQGADVVVISSGVIAHGRSKCLEHGLENPTKVQCAQAGREPMQDAWNAACVHYGITPYFSWVTDEVFASRSRDIAHAARTMLPIVNGDDLLIADRAQKSSDNDWVASQLARDLKAERLILITEAGGVRNGAGAIVPSLDSACFSTLRQDGAFQSKSTFGSGGVESKIELAFTALHDGASVLICGPGDAFGTQNGRPEVGTRIVRRVASL